MDNNVEKILQIAKEEAEILAIKSMKDGIDLCIKASNHYLMFFLASQAMSKDCELTINNFCKSLIEVFKSLKNEINKE